MATQSEPIAVIGTGCRFPGSCDTPSKLWELLAKPRDLLKRIPEDRFSADGFYHPVNSHHGTSNVRYSYLLDEDLRTFDAEFFGIKATEASCMDPQQRLLMETVYEALESAGLSVKQLQGSDTAVYVGVMSADFTDMLARDTENFPTYFATGTARSILSGRLSYYYDWHGPSMTIDTACSSSLIALHQAVQVLRSKHSKVAVAAGSNLILGPEQYIAESKLQMLSPDGRSRMWDAQANGYARGEGVAAVVLKTLSQAIADGDPVECIIRETGINQDGKTPGITMPSARAQAALIKSTYARAGLDLRRASDRPQFFEAHGTGTPAGDPIEAAAINEAFFGYDTRPESQDNRHETLFVGSVKTVIGHSEGTAGLAAIIKASKAVQEAVLPPNRLFNRLNPKIEPYYANLKIVTEAQPWPKLGDKGIRRVSVNSFGFGGTNAHAIVESADSYITSKKPGLASARSFAPCLLSAASDPVLGAMVERLKSYLLNQGKAGGINMRDLAWTLCNRRSTLGVRTVLPAAKDAQDLVAKLQASPPPPAITSTRKASEAGADLGVLGVFTGQGAQWPRMAAELIEDSPAVACIVQRLDQSLQALPVRDRPLWTLRNELLAPKASSRVYTASLAQPLCTALQIVLVDLLAVAGIKFSGVVGHSSGEIGAAYAAGYLDASDAIRVAYYRGLHLQMVTDKGAMLAAGTSFQDAQELCSLPAFAGRACVAASNSPASVTLSGDADAIEEIQIILGEEKKFNRRLQVDRAYHSHHMQVMAEPYRRSLEDLAIKVLSPTGNCRWVSSVYTCDVSDIPGYVSLASSYWVANLIEPVHFTEALEMLYVWASMNGSLDLAIEVGPHPALQGPVKQTVQEFKADTPLAYTGLLKRGENSTEALSKSLGYIWQLFGQGVVDFAAYEAFCAGQWSFSVHKGLPKYPWDHNRTLWQESRLSKAFRTNPNRPHELLGRQILDGVPGRLRWRNIIKRSEIDWLEGHQVQKQVVFPAAGYVSACIEACMRAFDGGHDGHSVQSIELVDFEIGHAMVFEDDDDNNNNNNMGVDATIELGDITRSKSGSEVRARFGFHSTANHDLLSMNTHASCQVIVVLGDSDAGLLPAKPYDEDDFLLLDIDEERFYTNLDGLGFGYSGPFRALQGLKRRLGYVEGLIQNPPPAATLDDHSLQPPLLVHPATLDAGIQSIMLAYSYPGDTMLRSVYVPTRFDRIMVNPTLCADFAGQPLKVPFGSVAFTDAATKSVSGDISIYSPRGTSFKALQLEGLQTRPLSDLTQSDGIDIFTEMSWHVASPDADTAVATTPVPPLDGDLFYSLERVAYYYHGVIGRAFPRHEREHLEWNFKRLLEYNDYVLDSAAKGTNPFARKEWQNDSQEFIGKILDRYPDSADLKLMRAVGENMVAVIRQETSMLEHMIEDNKLNNFYEFGEGFPRYTSYMAALAGQLAHRYPHMSVLEIGAGTGGATKAVLGKVGQQFSTYDFTDISGGFFAQASTVFAAYKSQMNFKVLDIEKDPLEQGFVEGSYDLVVASLVLHATRNLGETMANVRKLLKPGGYLLLLEITENEQMRFGLLFGGLPGWWLGAEEGRALSPCIGLKEWDTVFRQTGFGGLETAVPHHATLPVPLSVMVAQAMDTKVQFLKRPLAQPAPPDNPINVITIPFLTIVGAGPKSFAVASEVQRLLAPRYSSIRYIESLEAVGSADLAVGGSLLCLADLDGPALRSLDAARLAGFQQVFQQSKHVLWVTRGVREGDDPFARMVIGFGRTIVLEMLHLRLQFLDLESSATPKPCHIAEAMVRFDVAAYWDEEAEEHDGHLPGGGGLLHSIEPELFLDQHDTYFVPRFKHSLDKNNRYKSARGHITELVSTTPEEAATTRTTRTKTLELRRHHLSDDNNKDNSSSRWELFGVDEDSQLAPSLASWAAGEYLVDVQVTYSINRSVAVARNCFLFPILGTDRRSGQHVLALAPTLTSKVSIPSSFILYNVLPSETDRGVDLLETLLSVLMARAALGSDNLSGTRVILIEPRNKLADSVNHLAAQLDASLLCLSSTCKTGDKKKRWIQVGPRTPKLAIKQLIMSDSAVPEPRNYCVLDMTEDGSLAAAAIADLLPPTQCRILRKSDLTSTVAYIPARDCSRDIRYLLAGEFEYIADSLGMAKDPRGPQEPGLPLVAPSDTASIETSADFVLSWKSMVNTVVPVSVEPIETKIRFQSDKTYWLVGLTGNLGLSLCAWIVHRGARHIVLSSKNPKINDAFLSKMKNKGANIKVLAVDVCNRHSVQATYKTIKTNLPEVAGVCQGAMVLHDTMFSELDIERVEKVTKPKVQGSLHLEEIFHDTQLDFFVFFSSMASIVGNPGQSAYGAANMFMSGLATQRRNRGLNASAVAIGAIFGNGYVTRELTLAQQEYLKRVGNQWLSEQDFHTLFAEAVYAGQARRGKNPELATGLMTIDARDDFGKNVTWFKNPMFQHSVRTTENLGPTVDSGMNHRRTQPKVLLQEAISSEDVHNIIFNSFVLKLQDALQVDEGRSLGNLTADTLGIDSLVAVDIRSWFIKELQVEVSVLKILSGATIHDIVAHAQKLLPKDLIPNFDEKATGLSKPEPKPEPKPKPETKLEPNPATTPLHKADKQEKKWPASWSTNATKQQEPATMQASHIAPHISSSSPLKSSSSVVSSAESKSISNCDFVDSSSTRQETLSTTSSAGSGSGSWSKIERPDEQDQKPTLLQQQQNPVRTLAAPNVLEYLGLNKAVVASAGSDVVKSGPISFPQSRFWFLQHFLDKPESALNITMAIDLQGPLNIPRLEKAVASVAQRHEALRTRIRPSENPQGAIQEVLAKPCVGLEVYEMADVAHAQCFYEALAEHKYKLDQGENIRIILLRMLSTSSYRLLIGYHHINMDGVSLEVILRELQLGYDGKALPPTEQIMQYPDFARQQHDDYESGRWAKDLLYWRTEFQNRTLPVLPLLPLSKVQSRVRLASYSANTAEFYLDDKESRQIQTVCQTFKVSPFHFHVAIFYTLLARLTNVDELCIGVSNANRQSNETMQSIGMYLNLLPLFFKVDRNQPFANVIKMARAKALEAFVHAAVPFDVMVKELGVAGTSSYSPLFQAMVNYRPGVSDTRRFCDCESEIRTFKQGDVAYDLMLDIIENPGGACRIMLSGQSVYYGQAEMTQIKHMYLGLLKAVSQNPATILSAPNVYNKDDVKAAIKFGRGIYQKPKWPATLVHRIDEMAERYQGRIAVTDGQGTRMTYRQLLSRIGSISSALRKHNSRPIGANNKVGVLLDPGSDWICSLLAILRLGATYIPLEIGTGWGRLSSVVRDCRPDLILVNNRTQPEASNLAHSIVAEQLVNVEALETDINQDTCFIAARSDLVAAIIYTSGSTGVPKGIILKHESFRNTVEIMTAMVNYREGQETSLHQSSYNFDMSLGQILLTLSNGGTIYVVPRELRGDPEAISSIITSQNITFTIATPSEAISWIEYGDAAALRKSSWKIMLSGGEPVRENLTRNFRMVDKPDLELIDSYGPAEVTFCCCARQVDYRSDTPPATKSGGGFEIWPNAAVYVLDADRNIVPPGIMGEIALGGAGVVAGYSNQDQDTASFMPDAWSCGEFVQSGWDRIHLTGDTGRIDASDGTLVLGGRIAGDTQIKLRGMRVDLREVEVAMLQTAAGRLSDIVVTARENRISGATYLVAFALDAGAKSETQDQDQDQDFDSILAHLPLPMYMRPAAIILLDRFPTNPSGKIDRTALKNRPLPQCQESAILSTAVNDARLNDVELTLLQLWTAVISPEIISQYKITNESNFFHVGGTSILLVQLNKAIESSFGTKPTLFRLFEASTLGAMSVVIASVSHSSNPPALRVEQEASTLETDWERETEIPPELSNARGERDYFGNPTVIVLTGATGFLGRSILACLLRNSHLEKVHCLAVRQDAAALAATDALFRSPKIVLHHGDLGAPNFGLPVETLSAIFAEAHAVIHNGADVSFMKTYATLKPVNVGSTRELVRLSLPRHVSFHYVSSASIVQLTQQESWGPESVKKFPPVRSRNASGYVATKWASERYLEKISDQCDLPIWVHRPSSIKGPGQPTEDLISNVMHYTRETKAIPDMHAWNGWLDFVTVDAAAREIVDEVYKDYSWPGKVAYFYQSGGEIVPLADLRPTLEHEVGCEIEVLPMDKWVARAQSRGMSVLLGDYLCALANAPIKLTMLLKGEAWL